jgi:hypothetical protein
MMQTGYGGLANLGMWVRVTLTKEAVTYLKSAAYVLHCNSAQLRLNARNG